jgi:hypothetical protein
MEATLAELVSRCDVGRGKMNCPLVAALQEGKYAYGASSRTS